MVIYFFEQILNINLNKDLYLFDFYYILNSRIPN
jgi:hypothetical protein